MKLLFLKSFIFFSATLFIFTPHSKDDSSNFSGDKATTTLGATDGNGDGIIKISPMDTDGNSALAHQIKELIKDAIELLDD